MTIDNTTKSYYEISVPIEAPRKSLITVTLIFQAAVVLGADVAVAWFVSQLISTPSIDQSLVFAATVVIFILLSSPLLRGAFVVSEREVRQVHLEEMTAYDVEILTPVLKAANVSVPNTLELINGGTVHGVTGNGEPVLATLRNSSIYIQF